MIIYEYVETTDWMEGLDKGTRLYYDYDKHGYVYHYERENTSKNKYVETKSFTTEDYFINPETVEGRLRTGNLKEGPELGEFEPKKIE